MQTRAARSIRLSVESLEDRSLTTLVFVLSGNAYAEARPSDQTRSVAADLASRGYTAVQVTYPDMKGLAPYLTLGRQLARASKGQPVGLVGFSAGGTLALRLTGFPGLKVTSVLDFYGPPDLSLWLGEHWGDASYRRVTANLGPGRRFVNAMSGPGNPGNAHVVAAFGLTDRTVIAAESAASLRGDFPQGSVYYYPGPHGVNQNAQPVAYAEFLSYLPAPGNSASQFGGRFRS